MLISPLCLNICLSIQISLLDLNICLSMQISPLDLYIYVSACKSHHLIQNMSQHSDLTTWFKYMSQHSDFTTWFKCMSRHGDLTINYIIQISLKPDLCVPDWCILNLFVICFIPLVCFSVCCRHGVSLYNVKTIIEHADLPVHVKSALREVSSRAKKRLSLQSKYLLHN